MKTHVFAIAALVCSGLSSPAFAQDNGAVTPTQDRWVAVNAYPNPDAETPKAPSGSPLIRRAMPDRGLEQVFTAADGFVASWLSSNEKRGGFRVRFKVSEEGSVTQCAGRAFTGYTQADLSEACAILSNRARLLPALAADGSLIADEVEVWVRTSSGTRYSDKNGAVISHGLEDMGSNPPPPPAPGGYYWPHHRKHSWWRAPRKFRQKPGLASGQSFPEGAQWAGGFLSDEPGRKLCNLQRTSIKDKGEADAFKAEVCEWVEAQMKPRWRRARQYSNFHPFLFVKSDGAIKAYFPGLEEGTDVRISEGAKAGAKAALDTFIAAQQDATIVAKPTLRLWFKGEGGIDRCEVQVTSGNNAVDTESCRIISEDTDVQHATDIFGMPRRGFYFFRFGTPSD